MLLSKLKNIANKDKKNIDKYQPNFCLNLLRKTKKHYFAKLSVNPIQDWGVGGGFSGQIFIKLRL